MVEFTTLENYKDQNNRTLLELSNESPVFVLFLRHFGCTFCMEAVADIARQRKDMEAERTRIVFVHMSQEPEAQEFFSRYSVADCSRISDPARVLYRQFGLERGNLMQLFGPQTIVRGIQAFLKGASIGRLQGDGFQMPGAFLIYRGEVVKSFIHGFAGDLPDYKNMAKCDVPMCYND